MPILGAVPPRTAPVREIVAPNAAPLALVNVGDLPTDGASAADRRVLDALEVAVLMTDADGLLTYFNDAAIGLWGRRPAVGETWCGSWKLQWPDGRPMSHDECPMAICLRERRPVRGAAAVAERPDGSRVVFEPFPSPLFDASGVLIGGVNVLVDVTERQNAEEALAATAEALAMSSSVALMLLTVLVTWPLICFCWLSSCAPSVVNTEATVEALPSSAWRAGASGAIAAIRSTSWPSSGIGP